MVAEAGVTTVTLKGRAGRLLWRNQVVTEFLAWSGSAQPDGSWRVDVGRHEPDPLLWEHHGSPLTAELDFTLRTGIRTRDYSADVLSREPLILRLTERD